MNKKALQALNIISDKLNGFERYGQVEINKQLEIVLQALKRNEPKKPHFDDEYSYPECPSCYEGLGGHYNVNTKKFVGYSFCSACGQALDWETECE